MTFLAPRLTSFLLRAAQAVLAIINLGLSAGIISNSEWPHSRVGFTESVSIIHIIYIAFTIIPVTVRFLLPIAAIVLEIIIGIFWLIGFALIADDFGSISCNFSSGENFFIYYANNQSRTSCKIAKALIAFTLFLWLLSWVTAAFTIFAAFRLSRTGIGFSPFTRTRQFLLGGLFLAPSAAPTKTVDHEATGPVDSEIAPAPEHGVVDSDVEHKLAESEEEPFTDPVPNDVPISSELKK